MEWLNLLLMVFSLVMLFFGAEVSLNYSEKIGRALGFSPLVIGLVLVGFGTSLPEFFVSQISSANGKYEMSIGNILGSNVANILLILGVSSMFRKLNFTGKSMRVQTISHFLATSLMLGVVLSGKFDFTRAVLFAVFFVLYMANTFIDMKKGQKSHFPEDDAAKIEPEEDIEKIELKYLFFLILGFTLLYGGGELLVHSGSIFARGFGISEFAISAIFFAFGTSFPELFTALVAIKKNKDLSLITGNILGSNIFNLAFVLGSLGVYQFEFDQKYVYELSVLMGVSLLFILMSFRDWKLNRYLGFVFLGSYGLMVWHWL